MGRARLVQRWGGRFNLDRIFRPRVDWGRAGAIDPGRRVVGGGRCSLPCLGRVLWGGAPRLPRGRPRGGDRVSIRLCRARRKVAAHRLPLGVRQCTGLLPAALSLGRRSLCRCLRCDVRRSCSLHAGHPTLPLRGRSEPQGMPGLVRRPFVCRRKEAMRARLPPGASRRRARLRLPGRRVDARRGRASGLRGRGGRRSLAAQ